MGRKSNDYSKTIIYILHHKKDLIKENVYIEIVQTLITAKQYINIIVIYQLQKDIIRKNISILEIMAVSITGIYWRLKSILVAV
jgi:hypothetical protein